MNYQDRNTQSKLPAFSGFPFPPVQITTQDTTFTATIKDGQGNWGTPEDGWDPIYNPIAASEPQHGVQVAQMEAGIKQATFTPGKISEANYAPIGTKMADLIPQGDKELGAFNTHFLGGTATPPSGGGGGAEVEVGAEVGAAVAPSGHLCPVEVARTATAPHRWT